MALVKEFFYKYILSNLRESDEALFVLEKIRVLTAHHSNEG